MQNPSSRRLPAPAVVLAAAVALVSAFGVPIPARASHKKTFVQKRYLQVATGSSIAVSLRRPTTAGDTIVVYVVWDNAGAVSVADSSGNPYASAVGPTASPDGTHAQVLYARNVAGGVDAVTATFATPLTRRGVLYVHEYAGLDHTAPVGAAVATSGTTLTMDSGPVAATAGTVLFMAAESNANITRRGPGFRARGRRPGSVTADFTVVTPGTYDATAQHKGTAWTMQLVALQPTGTTHPTTAYPLKVGPTGRYLVDRNDRPFFMLGDSPQALTVNLSEAEADAFFADRAAAGFNLVWVNLLCATYTGGRADGSTWDGIVPFTTPDDLATPNEAFFTRVDHMLDLAAQHGLVVLLDPAETGSYLSVLNANGVTKARNYGRYLGTRYRSFDNIVWMSGNDFQSWPNPGDDAVVQAVARGIHDTDDRHLHTAELDYPVSGTLDDPGWAPLIDLNASYTYYPTYAQVLADYDRPSPLPAFMVEANYEYEHNAADLGTPAILRRQEYWTMLSGAAGQLYGNRYTWPFVSGWESHLDTPGSAQIAHVKALFEPRRWYDLIPDQSHTVVTAGYGTFADSGALGDSDYATAARTPDGGLVLAYLPTRRTVTVDMTSLAAAAVARWYDPADGSFTAIAGSPIANTGTHDFTPPGNNADGDGDWVLVLESTSVPPDTTPPSVPTGLAVTSVTASQVGLSWTASTDDAAVAGYHVYRDGVLVHSTPATTYTDAGLAPATAYSYTVAAYDYVPNTSAPSPPLVVTTASPGPEFVQQSYATPQTPQSVVSATYAGDQTAGDTNIVAIGWNDTAAVVTSIVDAAGNVYQTAVPTFRGNGMSQAIWYAASIVAAGAGSNVVTVTFDRPAVFVDLRVTEYAGLRHTSPFQTGVSATGNGSAAATGTLVTTTPSALLFAAGMTGTTFTAPGAGFTSRVVTSPDGDLIEDAVAATAGSYDASATLGSGTWVLQLAAFVDGP